MRQRTTLGVTVLLAALSPCQAGSLKNPGPLSAREEQTTFRTLPGLRVELAACEPEVVDPVAFAFDERGRLFVAEMPGYPNGGVGTGKITSGRIKLLEDRDGDGFFEKATLYAQGLRFPTGLTPWKGGLLVANAPDLIYLEDADGDGKAERSRVLYTGFDLGNIQQLLNSLQWGLDNWVHAVAGGAGGEVRSAEKPDAPAVNLRGRGIRFRPEEPGSLEPTSGGGQYGLAADAFGRWFTATNSQHLRHIVLPDHYLRRNPLLPVSAVTLDIPDHGPACKVFRVSPFEAWRVERTRRRKGGPDAKRFPTTELVPGGFSTSACSPLVYLADLLPAKFHGSVLVCDPANNLIHRDVLAEQGATFVARRGDANCEFLASTDNWFRPTWLGIGPDGAVHVADFYREAIETPLSLPDDIKKRLNLESRGRGRIWRIVPEGKVERRRPTLHRESSAALVTHLADRNVWWRYTAQRLLVERQDRSAVELLRKMAASGEPARANLHALWTLHGLGGLTDELIEQALRHPDAGVRENALKLADGRLAASGRLRKAVAALARDDSPRVRFQAAFTAGEADSSETAAALLEVARRDAGDRWTQTAVLSSAGKLAPAMLEALAADRDFARKADAGQLQLLTRLAGLVGARGNDRELGRALRLLGREPAAGESPWRAALLEGLGQGMQTSRGSLARLWDAPPAGLADAVAKARTLFDAAARTAADEKAALADRLAACRLLAYGPATAATPALRDLLAPQQPQDLQLAAVRALGLNESAEAGKALLAGWAGYGPVLRREVLAALFARADRVQLLLDALEKKQVLAGQIEPSRVALLKQHPDATVRKRASKLLAGQAAPERQKVIEGYAAALDVKADAARGKLVFQKTCATCHRLENVGTEVGPDLLAVLANKTPDILLVDILDPSREVDPRYVEYLVSTTAGTVLTGLIATETASSLTLRRAEKAEDVILRSQIETVQATARSLMPDGLETQLSRQDLADLIGYLQAVVRKK